MTAPRILFVCNAGPEVGGGHVMRSLTLARALAVRGAAIAFVAPPLVAAVLDAFAPDIARVAAASTAPDALTTAAARTEADALVFDHYGLSAPDHRAIARGRPVLVIDDLADRPLGADLVLDPGPERRAEDYAGLVPQGARLLLGPVFAPVRPEFAAAREAALARRGGPVRRVLVSLGLTDIDAVTARVVERLLPLLGEAALDVVLGSGAPSLAPLARRAATDPRVVLHVDTREMADLTARADAGVGAAGSTTWERCTLGLPSVLLILADNQRPAAAAMADLGAALVVDAAAPEFAAQFDTAAARLLADEALRASLCTRSAQVCDGAGAGRAADAFLAQIATRDSLP